MGTHSGLIFEEIKSRPCVWNVGARADSTVVIGSLDSRQRRSAFEVKSAVVKLRDIFGGGPSTGV